MTALHKLLHNFGPGILLAATAIGVSHLVQSVQAGAKYGLIMVFAIIFAHIVKYPFFEFATRYSNVKKDSLLQGYYEQHPSLLYAFLFLTILGLITIQSVVTLVGSAVLANIFSINLSIQTWSLITITSCAAILFLGRYHLLDNIIKIIILLLFIATLISAIIASTQDNNIDYNLATKFNFANAADILFLISFLGWMPCPLDCSVWNSLWVLKKDKEEHPPLKTALLDFRIGYIVMAATAILFLTLGSSLIYGTDQEIPTKAVPFVGMLFSLYTSTLGQAAFLIVALTALFTMFSTVITCLDAFPRVFTNSYKILSKADDDNFNEPKIYNNFLVISVIIPTLTLYFFLDNMASLIIFTTVISFLTTPVIAYFNYRLVTSESFPQQFRPSAKLNLAAKINIVLLVSFSIWFIVSRF